MGDSRLQRQYAIRPVHDEQLAGDLVPNPDVNQLVATGFHRNTLTSREGGVDVQQLRAEQVADRAGTTASVWLGLTMECARCPRSQV